MMLEPRFEVLPPRQRRVWNRLKPQARLFKSCGFYLAGGTALALQIGHRQSVDFDFFSRRKNITGPIYDALNSLPGFKLRDRSKDSLHADLDGVRLSFIGAYRYPLAAELLNIDGILMAGVTDIGLMKLLAITHRGTVRDYLDLAAILRDRISLRRLLAKSQKKYGKSFNAMMSLRALVAFDDIEPEMPKLLDKSLARSWKKILQNAVKNTA